MILLKILSVEPNSPAASKNNWLLGSLAASGTSLKNFFRYLYEREFMVVLIIWLPQRYYHGTMLLTIRLVKLVFS